MDVPGVLNADPRMFENTVLLDEISYKDSIELSYYGASVMHPKTLQPLQDRQIPLQVKSFVEPDSDGTLIHQSPENETHLPAFISKPNQLLISLGTRDFAFIAEENLSDIFETFARLRVKLNIMQNSAVNFSVCIDDDPEKVPALQESLKKK
jgi:aspartate kinase